MSFVGTRPEVVKYVKKYKPEYFATLLLPAGITSEASIKYKDEAELLDAAEDVDEVYITKVLPEKMKYNLSSIRKFSFLGEIATMIKTVFRLDNNRHLQTSIDIISWFEVKFQVRDRLSMKSLSLIR